VEPEQRPATGSMGDTASNACLGGIATAAGGIEQRGKHHKAKCDRAQRTADKEPRGTYFTCNLYYR